MRIKKTFPIWLLSLATLWILSSCVTTPQPVITGIPEGYVILKKEALTDLMEKCGRCKTELSECLEREKIKQ
jgi:hypothetical protein